MADREDVLFQAKLAEQAERYDGENCDQFSFLLLALKQKWWKQ